MPNLQYQTYEVLKDSCGEEGANVVLKYFETKIAENMEQTNKKMASKQDLMQVKHDLTQDILTVKQDLSLKILELEFRLTDKINKAVFRSGIIQYLAIVGSILAILNFMKK